MQKTIWRRYTFGRNFHAGKGVRLWAKSELKIGENFYIGRYSQIECNAIIGNDVMLANYVALVGRYDHNYQQPGVSIRMASNVRQKDYSWKELNQRVIIEDDVWIGYGSIVLSGVTIHTGSIVAAGSVVTGDVEPYSVYGGVPARRIRSRFDSESDLQEHIRLYRRD